jgi:hypothetical protein
VNRAPGSRRARVHRVLPQPAREGRAHRHLPKVQRKVRRPSHDRGRAQKVSHKGTGN